MKTLFGRYGWAVALLTVAGALMLLGSAPVSAEQSPFEQLRRQMPAKLDLLRDRVDEAGGQDLSLALFLAVQSEDAHTVGTTVLVEPFWLLQNAQYTLEVPACLLVAADGNCLEQTVFSFSTGADEERPMVLEAQPTEGQSEVPNDLPLVLTFSEAVRLNAVNNVVLRVNGQQVQLAARDIVVMEREVTIDLPRGYSLGNSQLQSISVELVVQEDAFRDLAGNSNELFELRFSAVAQRCGSSYLSSHITDDCLCYTKDSKCFCDCGQVTLFEPF